MTSAHCPLHNYKITMDFNIYHIHIYMYTDINNTSLSTIKLGYLIIQTILYVQLLHKWIKKKTMTLEVGQGHRHLDF